MTRILVTGSRYHRDCGLIERALRSVLDVFPPPFTLVHGHAPGADRIADYAWTRWGLGIPERHPADWDLGRRAGPLRNQEMVDTGADICLAFPLPGSKGTYDCMRRAQAAGIPVRVYRPGDRL